jgi:hypothetical protein
MPIVKGVSLPQQIKEANEGWFTPENKRFFNDIAYYGLYGKKTRNPYLVQETYAWTDMFGKKPRRHFRVHEVSPIYLTIDKLLDDEFATMDEVKEWLEEN